MVANTLMNTMHSGIEIMDYPTSAAGGLFFGRNPSSKGSRGDEQLGVVSISGTGINMVLDLTRITAQSSGVRVRD